MVFVFCGDAAWDLDTFTALELAKLLLYYQSLPRSANVQPDLPHSQCYASSPACISSIVCIHASNTASSLFYAATPCFC